MSSAPKGARGKRRSGPRPSDGTLTKKQQAKAARAARWDLGREKNRGLYGEFTEDKRPYYIDNRRFAHNLQLLANLRDEPLARLFLLSLISDDFLDGTPAAVAKRMAFELDYVAQFVGELVELELKQAARRGEKLAVRQAAEEVCARQSLPGNSFSAAVAMTEKQYRDLRDRGRRSTSWQPGETGGSWYVWPIEKGDFDLPDEGEVVPDDRFWRQRIFKGLVDCRYLPEKTGENHTRITPEIEYPAQA